MSRCTKLILICNSYVNILFVTIAFSALCATSGKLGKLAQNTSYGCARELVTSSSTKLDLLHLDKTLKSWFFTYLFLNCKIVEVNQFTRIRALYLYLTSYKLQQHKQRLSKVSLQPELILNAYTWKVCWQCLSYITTALHLHKQNCS